MTSSTSVSTLSEPSHRPPRYAAATPTRTAIPVVASPATNAMISTFLAPHTSCANMSCPYAVVPSRWAVDGPRRLLAASALGLSWAITPGKSETRMNTTSSTVPAVALRLERTARAIRASACVAGGTDCPAAGLVAGSWPGGPSVETPEMGMDMALPRRPGPRVKQRRGDVGEQDRQQHRQRDEQEQGLHQRVVLTLHRLQQHEAEARVVEHVLDQDGAADHEAE